MPSLTQDQIDKIHLLWGSLYPKDSRCFQDLVTRLKSLPTVPPATPDWFSFGPVYCSYPDAFEGGFTGLADQAVRLRDLGIKVLWLLPCLKSPGKDQGFDISDYTIPDPAYGTQEDFDRLLECYHHEGIRVIFDVAINHSSDQHSWFQAALQDPKSPYRQFYHWAKDDRGYSQSGLIFKGMVNSNWSRDVKSGEFWFHRFYPSQPDLNYTNPQVALEMIKILTDWKVRGVDGFRMDAAPFLWKEEGTDCMNRPQVHTLLKLFRACLDTISPDTLLLAEANLPTSDLVQFFGTGDECQGAYHFPLLPHLFQAFHSQNPAPILEADFPTLPPGGNWFTFLRLHDEVTLDLVSPEDRTSLVSHFAPDQDLRFRGGEAFSGRLFNLLGQNPERVLGAFSTLFSLPGTPLIYYGDEIAMENNRGFYEKMAAKTGFPDSRFFHRGPYDFEKGRQALSSHGSPESLVLKGLEEMLKFRKDHRESFLQSPVLSTQGPLLISRRPLIGQGRVTGEVILVTNFSGIAQNLEDSVIEPWGRKWSLELKF